MYDVTKPWVEGAQNGAAEAAGASWTNYNTTGPFPWGTGGASQTGSGSIDRGTVNLWSVTSGSFTPTGSKTVTLNAGGNGREALVGWRGQQRRDYPATTRAQHRTPWSLIQGRDDSSRAERQLLPAQQLCAQPSRSPGVTFTFRAATGVSTSPTWRSRSAIRMRMQPTSRSWSGGGSRLLGREILGTASAVASGAKATMAGRVSLNQPRMSGM